jgi:hypothetical protein
MKLNTEYPDYLVDTETGWIIEVCGLTTRIIGNYEPIKYLEVKIIFPFNGIAGFIDLETVKIGNRYRPINKTERILYSLKAEPMTREES